MAAPIRIHGRELKPHKATVNPRLGTRTVLTNSHWEYVTLWLKREHKKSALFFWQQAQTFAQAAEGMPIASAPLLLYYSFMNATKALLSAKGVTFDEHHGVRAHNTRGPSSKIALSNEGVRLMQRGIAPSLSQYLHELESQSAHSLESLLFNLPCIHRTFCITYTQQQDMFIPLTDCKFIYDHASGTGHFSANLSEDFIGSKFLRRLPATFAPDPLLNDGRRIRSVASFPLASEFLRSTHDIDAASSLLRSLRPDLHYLAGSQTLWYVKAVVPGPARLQRSPLTCTLLAMHRLSEICRYRPIELASFLSGQKNWLLTEFIRMSPLQLLDEISAELTGQQFMIPNTRPAT